MVVLFPVFHLYKAEIPPSLSSTAKPGEVTVSAIAISCIAFAYVFGGAVLGMLLRSALPQNHLSDDSRDVLKLGMALVATMSALVLGLLITSAKSSYDEQNAELRDVSVKVILLDRALAQYGSETKEMRDMVDRPEIHARPECGIRFVRQNPDALPAG